MADNVQSEDAKLAINTLKASLMETCIGVPVSFNKPITYVVCKNGFFKVKKLASCFVVSELSKEPNPSVEGSLREGIALRVPKIPFEIIESVLCFFRKIHEDRKTEVYISVWFDPVTKVYSVHVPEQVVGGTHVKHEQNFDPSGDLISVLEMHSHNTMGAFFSSGDDADEQRAERFYGVVGKLDEPIPQWKFRLRSNGGFLDVNPMMLIEDKPIETAIKTSSLGLLNATDKNSVAATIKHSMWVDIESKFDPEWLDKVKETSIVVGKVSDYSSHWNNVDRWQGGHFFQKGVIGNNPDDDKYYLQPSGTKKSKKDKKKSKANSNVNTSSNVKSATVEYIYIGGKCFATLPDGTREEVPELSL